MLDVLRLRYTDILTAPLNLKIKSSNLFLNVLNILVVLHQFDR